MVLFGHNGKKEPARDPDENSLNEPNGVLECWSFALRFAFRIRHSLNQLENRLQRHA
jgi:hypothetical protein